VSNDAFRGALAELAPEFGISLDASVADRFARHYELLLTWNRKVNLTRIVDPAGAARRHFLESAFLSTVVEPPERLVDVGSGAGFPGIPLACVWPRAEIVLVEPASKRAVFLREVARALGLVHVSVRPEPYSDDVVDERTLLTARALDGFRGLLPSLMGSMARQVALFSEPDLLAEAAALAPDRTCRLAALPGAERRLIGLFDR
jgi:16S rRNA (guanine527-N7)-methyltransferase